MANVLVVDDDAGIRHLLDAVLSAGGHTVATASEGSSGIATVLARPPDLMILDIMMPKMDGFMVLKELKRLKIREGTKVLLLTAKQAELDWVQGFRLGADDYLTKPFEVDELLETVERIIGMTKDELSARRQEELDKAQLLSRLESIFGQ